MNNIANKKAWERAGLLALLTALCATAVLSFLRLYQYDNKYTAPGPRARRGVLTLDEAALAQYPALYLVDGWEYYAGQLLSPRDFGANPPIPTEYIFIGQYGGFWADETAAGSDGPNQAMSHGSASYRLRIEVPDEPRGYALELPEIFSAYRLYVNGELLMRLGDPDPASYRPQTGNEEIAFEASGSIDILLAVSDYSHFYSGMVYPPAFGIPKAVSSRLDTRFLIRSVVCSIALTVGLLALLIGLLGGKKGYAAIYGLICLTFIGYAWYPITVTMLGGSALLYALERICFCAMLAAVMLLGRGLCGLKVRWSLAFPIFGAAVCAASLTVPLFLGNLALMLAYSHLISAYEWIAAGFLTFAAGRAVLKGSLSGARAMPLLVGILIFDTALVMDRLLPLFEPILTGWFVEIASFALVTAIGIAVGRGVVEQYRENAVLEERALGMERLNRMQQTYYVSLRAEMENTRRMQHDLRHHFTAIDGMLKNCEYEELGRYVAGFGVTLPTGEPDEYCDIGVLNVLAYHYDILCGQNSIHFDLRSNAQKDNGGLGVSDTDLCCLFGNLLENAVEACLRVARGKRFVRVGVAHTGIALTLSVENSTDGNVRAEGDAFASGKGERRKGYGLASVCSIAEKYDGSARFEWDKEKRVFMSVVTIMLS